MRPIQLFELFRKKHIVVIGDVMIDAYLKGKVNRMSPEAPVPIVNFSGHEERLGGAANVALNLTSLGAKVTMASVIGTDTAGEQLHGLLEQHKIGTTGLVASKERQTTIKTRVLGNNQQLLRIDQEQTSDIDDRAEDDLIGAVKKLVDDGCDAVIFEDYNKGTLTEKVIERVIAYANQCQVMTTVDPKLNHFLTYKEVTLFKPNLKELGEGLGTTIDGRDQDAVKAAIDELERCIKSEYLFVTMSEHGVLMRHKNEYYSSAAHHRNITDVSGAGDTVIAVATLCLTAGQSPQNIAEIANLAGGIVCEYPGVVAIDADRLLQEVQKLNIRC